jgi:hypothetical protein
MDEKFCRIKGGIETDQILEQLNRHKVTGINVLATFSNTLHNLPFED